MDAAQHDYLEVNREMWDSGSRSYQERHAAQLPTRDPLWGVWSLPERELQALGDVAGKRVVELGCGGAQFSIALARQGAACTGVDVSREQLRFAERQLAAANEEEGRQLDVTLVEANAEHTGLPDASFDVAFSDHGASIYCDPWKLMPEAARLLRPGGLLAFTCASPVLEACWPVEEEHPREAFVRDYFGMHAIEVPASGVNFCMPYGEWFRCLRESGFEVLDLVETRPPDGVERTTYRDEVHVAWSRRFPSELLWRARRR